MTKHTTPFVERFWLNVDRNGPDGLHFKTKESLGHCWVWLGRKSVAGYGYFYTGRRDGKDMSVLAHRYAYERANGHLSHPQIDHLCRNRICVNPAHLEAVTQAENLRRGASVRQNPSHCNKGHVLSSDNVYLRRGGARVQCKQCVLDSGIRREKALTAARTRCRRGHALALSASMRGGMVGKRYCPTCRAARTRHGVRGAGKAPD